jgi:hypothetical protein
VRVAVPVFKKRIKKMLSLGLPPFYTCILSFYFLVEVFSCETAGKMAY